MIKTKKYSYIDSIRGYAVLMVLCTHIYDFVCHNNPDVFLSKFWVQCRSGVMLFFMISALTLFLSMDKKIKVESNPVRNFFIRRFFRIAPLFYLLILINILYGNFSLVNIISTFSFTNGFIPQAMTNQIVGGDWSIAVEMMFYVLLPVLFIYITNIRRAFILFVGTLLFSIVAKYIMMYAFNGYYPRNVLMTYTYFWLPAELPVFSLGIMIYYILFKTDINSEFAFKKPLGYILILLGIYFSVVFSFSTKLFITENVAFSFTLMLFILGMAINSATIFNNIAIRFLGKISYSFYLIHWIVIMTMLKYAHNFTISKTPLFIIATIIVLVATTIISYVTYLTIEQPFQKLGSNIITRLETRNVRKQF